MTNPADPSSATNESSSNKDRGITRGGRNRWRARHHRSRESRADHNARQNTEQQQPQPQPVLAERVLLQRPPSITTTTPTGSPVARTNPPHQPADPARSLQGMTSNNEVVQPISPVPPLISSPSAASPPSLVTPSSSTIASVLVNEQHRHQAETARYSVQHNVLSSLASLNYRIPPGTHLDSPVLVLCKREVNGTTCFEELIRRMAGELEHLIAVIHQRPQFPARTVNVWKEDQMTELLVEIVPALAKLIERIGVEVKDTLRTQDGGLRVHVGGNEARLSSEGSAGPGTVRA